jgi:hypothetical protein
VPTRFSDLTESDPRKTAWNLDLITTFYTKCAYSPQTQVQRRMAVISLGEAAAYEGDLPEQEAEWTCQAG